jgi:lipoprotein signal peptidase
MARKGLGGWQKLFLVTLLIAVVVFTIVLNQKFYVFQGLSAAEMAKEKQLDTIKNKLLEKEGQGGIMFSLFSVSPLVDDFLIEDDFTIISPALSSTLQVSTSPLCTYFVQPACAFHGCWGFTNWECNDGKWKRSGKTASGGSQGISAISDAFVNPADSTRKLAIYGGQNSGSGYAQYLVDLSSKDVKIKFKNYGNMNIAYGSWSKDISGNQFGNDNLIEFIKSVTDSTKYSIILNGDYLQDATIVSPAYVSFTQPVNEYVDSNGYYQRYGNTFVNYIKSRPYFSCEVDNNEVIIRDRFNEGSTFGWKDLTYEPTKICPLDMPAVVRDFRERGIKADTKGTITWNLAHGASFTVPQYQTYDIIYITKYQEGMGERCNPLTDAYDTNTKTCKSLINEEDFVIKDCNTNPEICASPNKCELRNANYVCVTTDEKIIVQNCNTNPEICDAALKEECQLRDTRYVCARTEEVVQVIREKEFINVGQNQVSFVNNLADLKITTSSSKFKCDTYSYELADGDCNKAGNYCRDTQTCIKKEDGKFYCKSNEPEGYSSPNPQASCWTSSLNYNGQNFPFITGQTLTLDKYFDVTCNIGARLKNGILTGDSRSCILTIKNWDFLTVDPIIVNNEYFTLKDSKKDMCVKINNLLPFNFNGGDTIIKTTDLITTQSKIDDNRAINSGEVERCFSVDTSIYGEVKYVINTFINLNFIRYYNDDVIFYNYKMVDKIPEGAQLITATGITNADKEYVANELESTKTPLSMFKGINSTAIYVGIIAVIIIVTLIYMMTRKKRGKRKK